MTSTADEGHLPPVIWKGDATESRRREHFEVGLTTDGVVVGSKSVPSTDIPFHDIVFSKRHRYCWTLNVRVGGRTLHLATHDEPPWNRMPPEYKPAGYWSQAPGLAPALWILPIVCISVFFPSPVTLGSLTVGGGALFAVEGVRYLVHRSKGQVFPTRSSAFGAVRGAVIAVIGLFALTLI